MYLVNVVQLQALVKLCVHFIEHRNDIHRLQLTAKCCEADHVAKQDCAIVENLFEK